MIRPLLLHLSAQLRDALRPTILALVWCTVLIVFKRWTLQQSTSSSSLDDPPPAYTTIDYSKAWKDLEWAAYRVMASLSTVTGLLLAFRSNSAIDRWNTARRKWSDVQATSRSLLRLLGASLLSQGDTEEDRGSLKSFAKEQERKAKVEATIATVPFFSISLMAEMRGRSLELFSRSGKSLLREDLIRHLPPALVAAANSFDGDASLRTKPNKEGEKVKQMQNLNLDPRHTLPATPLTASPKHRGASNGNLALSSLIHLQRSLDAFHAMSTLAGPVYAHSIGLINSLTSHMTELERIRDTPIPFSVSLHFGRLLFIHSVLLPVVVVQRLSERWWLCWAIIGVVTSMVYGVDSFAARLGQPFGLDREDLPLEKYVEVAQREWVDVRRVCCDASEGEVRTGPGPRRDRGREEEEEVMSDLSALSDHED